MDKEIKEYWLEKDLENIDLNKYIALKTANFVKNILIEGYNLGFKRADDIWYNADYICDRCGVILKEMNNPNKILIETLEKLSKLGHEPMLGNSDGNVIAQKGLAKYYEVLDNPDTIEDGYGNSWNITCNNCKKDTMEVLKPGKVQCSNCG